MNLQTMLDDGTLKIYPYREDLPLIVETRSGIAEIKYSTGRNEQWLAELGNPDRIHLAMAMCSKFNVHTPEYKEFANMFAKDISENCIECDTSYTIPIYRIPDFLHL